MSLIASAARRLMPLTVLVLTISLSNRVGSVPLFLDNWKEVYPDSTSAERNCQLCHAFPDGGDPWNSYGFDIRAFYQGGIVSIETAIRDVEDINSDGPPNGSNDLTNIEEIILNLDPGWAPGRVNIHAYKNGDVVRNQPPPFIEGDDQAICFPIVASNEGRTTVICL